MKKILAIGALALALSATAATGITAYAVTRTQDAPLTACTAVTEAAVLRQ